MDKPKDTADTAGIMPRGPSVMVEDRCQRSLHRDLGIRVILHHLQIGILSSEVKIDVCMYVCMYVYIKFGTRYPE